MRSLLRRFRIGIYSLLGSLGARIVPEAENADEHWQRAVLNQSVSEWIERRDPSTLSAAEISGDNHEYRPWLQYRNLDFPDFDLLAPRPLDERFDLVICEQVLEHVVDPAKAVETLHGLLVPGGWAIVSTPFLIRVHELPEYGMFDYWRFTPKGLRALLERGGFEVDSVGSWGNRECLVANLDRWAKLKAWMPLRNEPDLPQQVWAFARKPE